MKVQTPNTQYLNAAPVQYKALNVSTFTEASVSFINSHNNHLATCWWEGVGDVGYNHIFIQGFCGCPAVGIRSRLLKPLININYRSQM